MRQEAACVDQMLRSFQGRHTQDQHEFIRPLDNDCLNVLEAKMLIVELHT